MLQNKDAERSERVMEALLKMKKIDIKTLKQAYEPSRASSFEKPKLRK
jgi:hypothetical protein